MELKNGAKTFHAISRAAWRAWLAEHHATEKSVWLIIYRKESEMPSVYYSEAVDEALCFGWIDSTPNKRDGESYYQFFARRNPKSSWSRVNKEKVARLTEQGLMSEAGQQMVNIAQQNGTWTVLDEVENLILPEALRLKLKANEMADKHWNAFPRSAKRGILEWIMNAKRPDTRQKRIDNTVALAEKNIRANYPRP